MIWQVRVLSLPVADLLASIVLAEGFLHDLSPLIALQSLLIQRFQILLLASPPWLCYVHLVAVMMYV